MNATLLPTLEPDVEAGYIVTCPHCFKYHRLITNGANQSLLLFYQCGRNLYLGAVAGRLMLFPSPVS